MREGMLPCHRGESSPDGASWVLCAHGLLFVVAVLEWGLGTHQRRGEAEKREKKRVGLGTSDKWNKG